MGSEGQGVSRETEEIMILLLNFSCRRFEKGLDSEWDWGMKRNIEKMQINIMLTF